MVSVVAIVPRSEEHLEEYIDSVFAQNYEDFELVLVFDASQAYTAGISEKFQNHENLYVTFIPPGSHNLSRPKLARTVGTKAAKGDVVVMTGTQYYPQSSEWLAEIAASTDSGADVVLGWTEPETLRKGTFGKIKGWLRDMKMKRRAKRIARGKIKRGDINNLAFRRDIFFDIKGFASTLPGEGGEETIFIRDLAKGRRATSITNILIQK